MIFLFIFCLYYVLYNRNQERYPSIIHPTASDLLNKQDVSLPSIYAKKTTFSGFSDYRFILSIIILIIVGLMSIPIGGLTGFHVYLIACGRTTNEQVTGKYRIQNDVFNRGFWKNTIYTFCHPIYPQLKAPKKKRYDTELFERMAYGKNGNSRATNGQTKPLVTNISGQNHEQLSVHINPIDETGRQSYFQTNFLFHQLSENQL